MIFLVRHAKAGTRLDSRKQDFVRPLSNKGQAQSEAIVDPLIAAGAGVALFASPFVRCMQTLRPLATRIDAEVVPDDRLAEASSAADLIDFIATAADGTVMCSHGDVIPDVISKLQRRGCAILTDPHWVKASVWVLERDHDGSVVNAWSWPAPDIGR
jgi:8-oxo-dGTP diphosphatase